MAPKGNLKMTNSLITKTFNDHAVRIVEIDGNPWFSLADVRKALGRTGRTADDRRRLAEDEVQIIRECSGTTLKGHGLAVLSESGLYKFVMRSDKAFARPFQDWVTREVLPAIRKTGAYIEPGATVVAAVDTAAPLAALHQVLADAQEAVSLRAKVAEQAALIEKLRAMVDGFRSLAGRMIAGDFEETAPQPAKAVKRVAKEVQKALPKPPESMSVFDFMLTKSASGGSRVFRQEMGQRATAFCVGAGIEMGVKEVNSPDCAGVRTYPMHVLEHVHADLRGRRG